MQTFLPYADFAASARCLDWRRLGKQRVEVLQLLKAIREPGSGWSNHPAAKMWRGYEPALVHYGLAVCREWAVGRGYKDTCAQKMRETAWYAFDPASDYFNRDWTPPPWIGDPAFHAAHRSNLLRKDPGWYGRLGWSEPADLPYLWPERSAVREIPAGRRISSGQPSGHRL